MDIRRLFAAALGAVFAATATLALAPSDASAADFGPVRPHRRHHRRIVVEPRAVPLGYAYGGYGNGIGPGWELSGVGPGYGYGFAPGYGYLGPGYANYGLDLGY